MLIDQLREIYVDGDLEPIEIANWYPKVMRKDFVVALNLTENSIDDPDQGFYENFVCGADRNYGGYCNPDLDKLVDQQSAEPDIEKRKRLVWEIDRRLQEDGARPLIYHNRAAACSYPDVKEITFRSTRSTTVGAWKSVVR